MNRLTFEKHFLFGCPFYKASISPDLYGKQELIRKVEENYRISPDRNEWDKGKNERDTGSKFHHTYNDDGNDAYHFIEDKELTALYNNLCFEIFKDYMGLISPTTSGANLEVAIENFTGMDQGQFMLDHEHIPAFFSGVHYIQFDNQCHPATSFTNPDQTALLRAEACNYTFRTDGKAKFEDTWLYPKYSPNANEDDVVVWPSHIRHNVPYQHTKGSKLRITSVFNLYLCRQGNAAAEAGPA